MRALFFTLALQLLVFAAPPNTDSTQQKNKPPAHKTQPVEKKTHKIPQTIEDTEDLDEPKSSQPQLEDNFQRNFIRTLIAVLVIIVLALIVLWIIKKMSSGHRFSMNHKRNIKVLEYRAISGQTVLYHIEVGGKQLIMAESKCHVKTLTELDWPMADHTKTKKL